jgi:two-component system LytT family response regulator
MNVVIVDDEDRAQKALSLLIQMLRPEMNIVGTAHSVSEAVIEIKNKKPEVVFLDINLIDGDGFDILNYFPHPSFHVVFVTAYNQYALKAFEYSALDYLVKPIDHDDLMRVFDKLDKMKPSTIMRDQLDTMKQYMDEQKSDHIIINTEKEYCRLSITNILRLEADGNYSHIWTRQGKKYMVSKGLKHFETLFGKLFFRVHHSHLVNLRSITRVVTSPDYAVELQNGERCPVSQRKKKELMEVVKGAMT